MAAAAAWAVVVVAEHPAPRSGGLTVEQVRGISGDTSGVPNPRPAARAGDIEGDDQGPDDDLDDGIVEGIVEGPLGN